MEDSWSTFTGISCVITVSRSRGPVPPALRLDVNEPAVWSRGSGPWEGKSGSEMPMALFPVVQEDARMVRARRGMSPFLVRRSWADVAPSAERRARWRAPMGTSRFIAPELDCRVYVVSSKIAS